MSYGLRLPHVWHFAHGQACGTWMYCFCLLFGFTMATLSHYSWGSLTHQILITFWSSFEPKVTESLIHYRNNRNVTCGIGLMFFRKEIRFHVKEECAFWRQILSNFQQVQFNVFDFLLDFYFVTCFSSKTATNRWKPLKLQSCEFWFKFCALGIS